MPEVCSLQLTDDTDIEDVVELLDHLEDGGYVFEERWSDGEIGVRERENQTLEDST